MCLTRRITTGLCLLILTLVAYSILKITFVSTRFFLKQRTVRLTKPGNQQWQGRPLMNSNANFVTETLSALTLSSLNTSCVENHLGLTKYASELCSRSSEFCSILSCQSLLSGNKLSEIIAQDLMSNQPLLTASDESFINPTLDCESFKRHRAYHVTPLTDEETSFPVAFSLLVDKSAHQVEVLLRALYRPQNVYCIHVDAKSSETFISAVHAIAGCFENVFIASRLEVVSRVGFSHLRANINCMQDLLEHKTRWRYLLNVAGHSFPLQTVPEMVKILQLYNGTNDIKGVDEVHILRKRFELEWLETNGKYRSTGRQNPKPPHDIDIVHGSAYGIFSRDFVEFVLTDHRAADFLVWSKLTLSPAEHYWATLHHTYTNPHLRTPGAYSG